MSSSSDKAIEMYVGGLVLDPNTQAPIVVLKDESGSVVLPIWIGIAEATSIASAIKQVAMARPLTHDLMYDIFLEIGMRIERVMISDLRDSTYFSELVLAVGDKVIIVDARPSDAIALALRASAPIFVAQAVLDQAKVAFGKDPAKVVPQSAAPADSGADENGPAEEAGEEGASGVDESNNPEKDFKHIDKDKWAEILSKLDIDDFKYKM